ncbi:MAG: YifB family Mg chelatase-like AAA ATPase [Crocinitomicaceae bacterium]|nr:YifB family Mg chelatase-like AAA ATPase [Crocinitomicaceae bacterium]
MLVKTFSSSIIGITGYIITIEVNIEIGINFYMVGLPDNTVKESQQRVRKAIINNKLKFPGKEITINMAPANIKKEGSHFDLSIAIGILASSKQLNTSKLKQYVIVGELSLDGTIQKSKGVLAMAIAAKKNGFEGIIIPAENVIEVSLIDKLKVVGVNTILDVVHFFNKTKNSVFFKKETLEDKEEIFNPDFKDVKGQKYAKRAFEIAATGNHNILLIGPPGSGKTMLAKCIGGILPNMKKSEAIETAKIYSIYDSSFLNTKNIYKRPFRKPHHSISNTALVGGGINPKPGEISMAHNGILFLDELAEFKKSVLEVLRQPLEDQEILISRAKYSEMFPANFMLIAAMNPCPCGNYTHPSKNCKCSPGILNRYLSRISGPLLDRIDMHIEVDPVSFFDLNSNEKNEPSLEIKKRVEQNRKTQILRFKNKENIDYNSRMKTKELKTYCCLDKSSLNLIKNAMEKLNLSARSYNRILKVSRTIADMDNKKNIEASHIAEAIQYRTLDRIHWAA